MLKSTRTALVVLLLFTIVTGFVYPLAVTAIAQLAFPHKANGSIVTREGKRAGSDLIGQPFSAPGYFWSRPSATGPAAYNAGASSGSNYGPLNPSYLDAVRQRIQALKAVDSLNTGPVPVDLVTASASGLDPHISPAAAEYQVARVARIRGLSEEQVRSLVRAHTQGRQFGFLGEAAVNVLPLNLALDALVTSTEKK
jgi:K+-transporting ATPase ATPase C chain